MEKVSSTHHPSAHQRWAAEMGSTKLRGQSWELVWLVLLRLVKEKTKLLLTDGHDEDQETEGRLKA